MELHGGHQSTVNYIAMAEKEFVLLLNCAFYM